MVRQAGNLKGLTVICAVAFMFAAAGAADVMRVEDVNVAVLKRPSQCLMNLVGITSAGRTMSEPFAIWCINVDCAGSNGHTVRRQFNVGRDNPRSIGIMI